MDNPPGCKEPDCTKPAVVAEQWCMPHYRRQHEAKAAQCSVEECGRRVKAGGLCSMHYQRQYLTGDLGPAATYRIRGGRTAQEAWDAACKAARSVQRIPGMTPCLIHDGTVDDGGYAQVTYGTKRVARLSRLALQFGAGLTFDSTQMASHRCEDSVPGSHKRCFATDHLYLGTARSNSRDAEAAGKKSVLRDRMTLRDKVELVSMARAGSSATEIANELSFTVPTIREQWRRLCPDVPFAQSSTHERSRRKVVALHAMFPEMTAIEIAKDVGINERTVRNILAENVSDVTARIRPPTSI